MMQKFGRLIPTLHQLVIHDVFIKISHDSSETDECENDETVDEVEDSDGLTILGTEQENALMLNLDISHIVNKVRRVSKLFKRSPLITKFCKIMLKKSTQMDCS